MVTALCKHVITDVVCQGQSGLGKSTLVNSLFLTDLYQDAAYPNPAMRIPKTTEVYNYML